MNTRERALLVDALGEAIADGGEALAQVPALLKRVLKEGTWKEFETKRGKHVTYDRFEDFVTTPPLAGLGASLDLIERIVKDDDETLRMLNHTLRRPHGGDHSSEEAKSKIDNVNLAKVPSGNSKAYALQKLSDEGQIELLEQVQSGKISANEAMKQAGYRRPRISVYLDDPQSAAVTLLTHASPEFIDELRKLLNS